MNYREPRYLPSPEEIRIACSKIREEWSEDDERIRRGADDCSWLPPGVQSGAALYPGVLSCEW